MRFLLSALGSAGDVHPFVAIAQALQARGHDVRLIASPHFEERICRAGVAFVPMGTADDYERMLQRPELWQPGGGARLIFAELLKRLPEAYEATAAAVTAFDTRDVVLVGSTLSWGMRLVQERERLPGATVHLSPVCLQSAIRPPVLPGIGDLSWMPPWALRIVQWAGERLVLDRAIAPELDRIRASLGLAPVRRVWSRWMHSPDLVVAAWPEWFAPWAPDWPPHTVTTGFPLFDEGGGALDPALESFLQAGPPPIGVTPGSAMAHGEAFFARALAACDATGRRVLAITPFREQLPARLPEHALHVPYAPFSALLPRLAALVHHGGIGTCAQALAAGLPQVVVPFAHDQFDNAARLRRLGVAGTLKADASGNDWSAALRRLDDDRDLATAIDRAAELMSRSGDAAANIALRLEELGMSEARVR